MFAPAKAPDDTLRAVLATLAPALFAPVLVPDALVELGVPPPAFAAGFAALLLAPVVRPGALGRALATVALCGVVLSWSASHPDRPGLGLTILVGAGVLLTAMWPGRDGDSVLKGVSPVGAASSVAVVLAWLGWTAALRGAGGDLAIAGSSFVAAAYAQRRATVRVERQLAAVALLWPVVYAMLRLGEVIGPGAVPFLALTPLMLLSRSLPPERVWLPAWRLLTEVVVASPPRLLVSSFALACVLGTVLLALPISDRYGVGLPLVDAAFTAVGAVCVTGLTVVPATRLSGFGELVVAALVQLGGLGILSFASVAVVRGSSGLLRRETVASMLQQGVRADLQLALKRMLLVTFVAELVGAALLLPGLLSEGRGLRSPWEAVFLAISAFCNAGFVPGGALDVYARSPWILLVLSGLVLVGSLGPMLILALPDLVNGRKVPMAVRLAVVVTISMLVVPFVLLLGLEWSGVLGHLPAGLRVANAWLLTVSPRSAGFTAVDLGDLEPATWSLFLFLMFVGGNSGSTAGGIKITTFAVLVLAAWAAIRGRRHAEFGCRQIPHRVVYEAVAVTSAMLATVAAGLVLLQLTQRMELRVLLFEVVSAAGTSGLTLGGIEQVDALGKVVLAACTFAGRVGPLSLFLLLSTDREREDGSAWPSEEVPVG